MPKLLRFLLLAAFPLSAYSNSFTPSRAFPEPQDLSFCDLAKDPAAHNHELVRLTAFVTHGFEDFALTDPSCPAPPQHFSVWVIYGGKTQSNTVYCCPGEAGKETRSESLTVEGIQIPLLSDSTFQGFVNLLKKEPDTIVRLTVVGTFFSGEKETFNGSTLWRGYGHLGCCSLFALQRIEAFEPHTRSDLDYTAEAGYYEKEGCKFTSLQNLLDVSIAYPDDATRQAIADQRMADSGVRAWAFDNPQRVAIESLKPFYQNQVPVLRTIKRTSVRQVFRWKNGRKSVVAVVTRPYWLSFYAKSNSVAWVSTTIKEAECE
jgi:hypothetical protein